jgi:hypothetical protein
MDPALKAQQEEHDRKEEEQERKLLDLAFATYDPEAEDASAKLYQALEKSRFAVVRAEYFHCYGEFETRGNADCKQRMKRLAHQEMFLLVRNGPSSQRIMKRKDQIIAKKKAHLEKSWRTLQMTMLWTLDHNLDGLAWSEGLHITLLLVQRNKKK